VKKTYDTMCVRYWMNKIIFKRREAVSIYKNDYYSVECWRTMKVTTIGENQETQENTRDNAPNKRRVFDIT
jgi:hypothetical protein